MHLAIVFLFGIATWLNPLYFGPTPSVIACLIALACTAILMAGYQWVPDQLGRRNLTATLVSAWLFAALVSSVMGLLQYFGVASVADGWVSSAALGDAYGNLRQRNQFASLINIGLVAVLWSVAQQHTLAQSKWLPIGAVASAYLLALANAASTSRTGLAQLAMLTTFVLVWSHRYSPDIRQNIRRILIVAVFTYVLGALLFPGMIGSDIASTGILSRLRQSDSASVCSSRITLWSNVLQLIAQKPWTGWGWGELDYAHFITLYPGVRFCDILDNAHNLPLHLAVELGVPISMAFCTLCIGWVLRAKPWRETNTTRQMAWGILAVIGLHSLLEYPLWYGPFQLAVVLALWMLQTTPEVSACQVSKRLIAPVLNALVAAVLLAFCAFAAWDYWRISQVYTAPERRHSSYREDTLAKVSSSWLFQNQVQFAELVTTDLTSTNAAHVRQLALALLHFSPEPRVIEAVIESAVMLGQDDEALYFLQRYKAAFPEAHAAWAASSARYKVP
ncbi:MAG: polymerase [Burkholderiales bacterium PBB3]|nr:MAG: polymerase [Burkholderiales bacterium PBB3]